MRSNQPVLCNNTNRLWKILSKEATDIPSHIISLKHLNIWHNTWNLSKTHMREIHLKADSHSDPGEVESPGGKVDGDPTWNQTKTWVSYDRLWRPMWSKFSHVFGFRNVTKNYPCTRTLPYIYIIWVQNTTVRNFCLVLSKVATLPKAQILQILSIFNLLHLVKLLHKILISLTW